MVLRVLVWPFRNWRLFSGSRTKTRLLVVGALLLFVFTWRLDQAVKTAYDTRWFSPSETGTPLACESCLRLPSERWVWAYLLATVLAFAAVLWAARQWRLRCVKESGDDALRKTTRVAYAVIALCAVLAVYYRAQYAGGDGQHATTIVVLNVVGIATAIGIAVAATNLRYQARLDALRAGGEEGGASPDPPSLKSAVGRFIQRQRLNLVLVFLLGLLLTVVGDTSGQAIDSIRSWSVLPAEAGEVSDVSGPARLLMGLATSLLLALVLYESGLRLTQTEEGSAEMPTALLKAVGTLAAGLGLILWAAFGFGPGLALAGGVIWLILLLELPDLEGRSLDAEERDLLRAEQRAPEWLAIAPLLGFAVTSVAACVDAALSGGVSWRTALIGAPALILGLLAVLMTSETLPPRLERPSHERTAAVVALPIVAGFLLVWLGSLGNPDFLDRPNWPALFGGFGLLVLVAYTIWLFRAPHGAQPETEGLMASPVGVFTAYVTPFAVGAGIGVLVAIHLNPIEAGRTLGVLALANLSLAVVVVFFLFLVLGAVRYRPPKLLWWFGFRQLPVLTFVFLWWIVVGLIGSDTLHDVRIVDRSPISTADRGQLTPPKPTLAEAFDAWVAAQPELVENTRGRPVPLVLVASHGGGIRAAYWTASALDCIVGVSAAGTKPQQLDDPDHAERERTCSGTRRTVPQQRTAAGRIFLASGVSGGAVGLYAYARQLLHNGQLGDEAWVDRRLSQDFASPAVAWALFHDMPNRLLGLRPERGGGCRRQVHEACWTDDRAAVLENAFDDAWETEGTEALLRKTYDLRSSDDPVAAANARLVPVIVANSTLTGGHTRAVSSAVDLGAWPQADIADRRPRNDPLPLAGTIEITDAICEQGDLRLSTATVLAARFPYVTPSGHIASGCGRSEPASRPPSGPPGCTDPKQVTCDGSFVDGGYVENSGLFTIIALWPSLRYQIATYNADKRHTRKIAPLIIELDNHYQTTISATVPSGGTTSESLIPILTALGGRNAMQTYARAAARRLLRSRCMLTISPSLHPGLIAPLGWELSPSARRDLRAGRTEPHPAAEKEQRAQQIYNLRLLQDRLSAADEKREGMAPPLRRCLPG